METNARSPRSKVCTLRDTLVGATSPSLPRAAPCTRTVACGSGSFANFLLALVLHLCLVAAGGSWPSLVGRGARGQGGMASPRPMASLVSCLLARGKHSARWDFRKLFIRKGHGPEWTRIRAHTHEQAQALGVSGNLWESVLLIKLMQYYRFC